MKFAIAEMTFSPPLAAPMTYDHWMQVTQDLDECIPARNIAWVCSLVSVVGDRSLCIYGVPDADAVREAYREARVPFQRIWPAELWLEQAPTALPQGAVLMIAEVDNDPPITKATLEASKQQAEGCFYELNIQHAFSAISLDGTRSVCAFLAASAEDVRSLYRKANQPFQQVWKATLIQPHADTPPLATL